MYVSHRIDHVAAGHKSSGLQIAEYKRVRPFFSCDYYPLFGFPLENTAWTGWQYDRPEEGDGITLAFRRPGTLSESVTIHPCGLASDQIYVLTDTDSGEIKHYSGKELLTDGLTLHAAAMRTSRLIYYNKTAHT